MGSPALLVQGAAQTIDLTVVTTGTVGAGSTIDTSTIDPERGLSAKFVLLAETNTITLSAIWQVSDDNSTWVRIKSTDDITPTVVGTGTAGADTAVTVVLPAPHGVYGWRYVRAGILVGVTNGASGDTGTIAYRYARPGF